ncbi:hypothetical protein ACGFYQ_14215 [Streptomyces sp. NPDC048258]|uniref:hypothetical protein n=1 Tax=Streptomyces sp. NPDC048258 TaxID=3365527 RepID=UPI003715A8D8
MDQTGTDQILASKWDIPFALFTMARVLFGGLPLWAKVTIIGIMGSIGVWTAITWRRERRGRVT